MAKIYGHTTSELVPQSDFNANSNDNGGWEASQSFRILKGDLDNTGIKNKFPPGATLGSLDPNCDSFFSFLRVTGFQSVRTIEGGWTELTVKFVGFQDSQTTNPSPLENPVATYHKRGALSEASLNEHPKWIALDADERTALGKLLTGEFSWGPDPFETGGSNFTYIPGDTAIAVTPDPITSADGLEFAQRISEGKTTYKFGTYEYFHRWEDNVGISASQMNNLGKIATPSGSPPEPGTGRDWMMTGADEEQYGSGNFRFTNQLSYLLSDEGGHDSFLQS